MITRLTRFTAALGVGLLTIILIARGAWWTVGAQSTSPASPRATACLVNHRWGMMSGWVPTGQGMAGRGMMQGQAQTGAMWGSMGTLGMMGSYPAHARPISRAEAQQRLASFAASCGSDIRVGDIMSFSSNYYATLIDGSGAGAGEVLVDRYTGAVYPEPGPNMMWNTAWGAGTHVSARYDQPAAEQLASTFLATYLPGARVLEGEAFPGYDTFDFGRTGVDGMLSVNTATGEIWVHTWHGPALPQGT